MEIKDHWVLELIDIYFKAKALNRPELLPGIEYLIKRFKELRLINTTHYKPKHGTATYLVYKTIHDNPEISVSAIYELLPEIKKELIRTAISQGIKKGILLRSRTYNANYIINPSALDTVEELRRRHESGLCASFD